ncbi:MAG: HTH domain-containing protein [Pseudomonadota bacterium]
MPRQDRLYALIQTLKDGQLHTAQDLAQAQNVSVRTLYRDMETLMASGVPVRGERGVGYHMTAAYTLPALNLSRTELEALHLGLAAVGAAEDTELAGAARALAARIDGVLPEDRAAASGWNFATYPFADAVRGFQHMPALRKAMRNRQKVSITIQTHPQTVRPLGLDYWGRVWTLACWSETKAQFATIRVDQITDMWPLPAGFVDEPGKTMVDYLKARPT